MGLNTLSLRLVRSCFAFHQKTAAAVTLVQAAASWSGLQDRLLTVLIALGTQVMRGLAILHVGLQTIGKYTRSTRGQLIAFRLSFPVFQCHNFLFTLAYALGERRLLLLEQRLFLLNGQPPILSGNELGKRLSDCGVNLIRISYRTARLLLSPRRL